jgi:hypothetical protein
MALTKEVVTDTITVTGDNTILIRETIRIYEDGLLLTERYNRKSICPGADLTQQDNIVQRIGELVHTSENIQKYKDDKAAKEDKP